MHKYSARMWCLTRQNGASMNRLTLDFHAEPCICLGRTEFEHSLLQGRKLIAVRGKEAGAYVGASSFQWTSGVRGLCALFVRAKLMGSSPCATGARAHLEGARKSLASALD